MDNQDRPRGGLTRRNVLRASAAAFAAQALPRDGVASGTATHARGAVFEDIDGSGIRHRDCAGIPGVMVSNGHDVTLTDSNGSWQLPVSDGDSIFIIKPSHWSLTGPTAGIPRFSYLHQSSGSPDKIRLRHGEGTPTNALPRSIDFALRRLPEATQFDVLLVADTQPGSDEELEFVRDSLLARVIDSEAAFAIHHGDVVGDRLDLYRRYARMLEKTGMVWHHCPGNHDLNLDAADPRFSLETWKRVFGPPHYAFQHGGVTFIMLNNVDYFGAGYRGGGRPYRGLIGQRQLAFVANVLKHVPPEQLVVVSMHIPLVNFEAPDNPADITVDRAQILSLLSDRPHSVSFSGHSHTTEHHMLDHRHGFTRSEPHHHQVLTAACGSWWSGPRNQSGVPVAISRDGSPKGFHILSVDGNSYRTRFVAADAYEPPQLRLLVAQRSHETSNWQIGCQVCCNDLPIARVFVDVFDARPTTRVQLEIDGTHSCRLDMERTFVSNPLVEDFFNQYRHLCRPWVEAAPSSHLWSINLPQTLPPGIHKVTARVFADHGQEIAEHLLLEISA